MKRNSQHNTSAAAVFLPWIVVGVIVIIALVVAAMFVNYTTVEQATSQPDTQKAATAPASRADSKESKTAPAKPGLPKQPPVSKVPKAEVGNTYEYSINQWGKKLQMSHKLAASPYVLVDSHTAIIDNELIRSLPDSCSQMRTGFGFKLEGDKVTVVRPEAKCPSAPALYDEIWGLLAAAAATAR